MNIICNNCGKPGHISKDCLLPITSYGVLLLDIKKEPKIVMIQRKDSLCYIEIIRGKYDINNIDKIKLLLNRISKKEIENIKKKSFDELWKDLWLINDIDQTKYMKEYISSKRLYYSLKENKELDYYINNNTFVYEDSEWEFPKGKKNINKNEKNYDCAKRELCEETNIHINDFKIIKNISPIIEDFIGENNIKYRNIYYIGICNNINNIKINKENKDQITEIKDVSLLTYEEAKKKIRNYNNTKIEILDKIFDFIKNYQKDLILNNNIK